MCKSLKNFIFVSMMLLTLLIFGGIFIFSTYLHTTLTKDEAVKTADAIASQTFASMYQVMRKGWSRDEMETFLHSLEESYKGSSNTIYVYRGPVVEKIFGKIDQKSFSPAVTQALKSGEKRLINAGDTVTTLMPLKAKSECLSCHLNAGEGTVLGVIEVSRDLSEVTLASQIRYGLFFLIALPFVMMLFFFLSRYVGRNLDQSIEKFNEKVTAINTVKDFKELDIGAIDLRYTELNKVMGNINILSEKLKNIAVDKDLLEFEIRLLDKFIITTDVVRDWKEYIKELIIEINSVMSAYSLLTMFRIGDDAYEIEIFWIHRPQEQTKRLMESIARKEIEASPYFDSDMHYHISHNIADTTADLKPLTAEEIELQSKSLFLEAPKIGGIVGIGVQSLLVQDQIRHIVIEGILTTLINLVGSVKAIHKYTNELEYYATRDPLTALFNQRVFRDLLDYEKRRAEHHQYNFAVLVIDCDNFKPINDRYGHSFGDDFLRAFAEMLEKSKRPEDILARYGGDEFTLILPECSRDEAHEVASTILNSADQFELDAPDGSSARTTVSIGMAIFPEHATEAKDLFNIADAMMYRSKRMGKNSITLPGQEDLEEVFRQAQDNTALVLDAIRNDKIVPHFQPIIDIESHEKPIHELLMRIEMSDDHISASDFIEIAETMGVIHQMDYIVIEKAFSHIRQSGYDGLLFINLSPRSLIIGEFMEKIIGLTHKYGIKRSNIVFEITERETVKSFALLEKFVHNLKLEGFSFAIDDFGSGFSTFHYIKKFPIDYIKIDGEFITNIDKDPKDLAFVKSIVALAQELKVKTIAEFVENEEVLNFLHSIGIDYAQGYHIGKPGKDFTHR